jgi:DNA-binding Lrp family transcriptional regulator
MNKRLQLLESDCTLTADQLAALCAMEETEVRAAIAAWERDRVILGYHATVDWSKTDRDDVTALIEVKVTPQRGRGFDRVAERIYQYDEVESLYLMSGAYDLCVIISGRTLRDVALFVSQKLATTEDVTGTATHFILKRYKEHGVIFPPPEKQEEGFVFS